MKLKKNPTVAKTTTTTTYKDVSKKARVVKLNLMKTPRLFMGTSLFKAT